MTAATCTGCAHAVRRFRRSQPRTWCQRYQQLRTERCLDYRRKPTAIAAALNALRLMAIK